MRNERLYS